MQLYGVARSCQLIVRNTTYNARPDIGRCLNIQDTANCTRSKHLDILGVNGIGLHGFGTQCTDDFLNSFLVDVGYDYFSTGLREKARQFTTGPTNALNGHTNTGKIISLHDATHGRTKGNKAAHCRRNRCIESLRILTGAGKNVITSLGHEVSVLGTHTDVDSRPVCTGQALNMQGEGPKQRLFSSCIRVCNDHRFPTPQGEVSDGILVCHPPRQSQGIRQCGIHRLIRVHTATTGRGTELSAVNGYDRPKTGITVTAINDVFMIVEFWMLKQ